MTSIALAGCGGAARPGTTAPAASTTTPMTTTVAATTGVPSAAVTAVTAATATTTTTATTAVGTQRHRPARKTRASPLSAHPPTGVERKSSKPMRPSVTSPSGKPGSTLTLTVDVKTQVGTIFVVKNPQMNAYRITGGRLSAGRVYASMREGRRYRCRVVSRQRGKTSADYQPAMVADCVSVR